MAVASRWNYDTYTTSTGPADHVYYYTTDEDGNSILINTPEYQYNNSNVNNIQWYEPQPQNSISIDGEEIMRFNNDLQIKIGDEWVSVSNMKERVDRLESVLEEFLGKAHMNHYHRQDLQSKFLDKHPDKKEEVEHIDPDLFEV